jgi:predicted dehydrogenase
MTPDPDVHERSASPSTRRDFLLTTAALTGAVAVAACATTSGTASGPIPQAKRRTPLSSGDPIRMGLIGTGGMGNGHLDGIMDANEKGREKVQVVALSDVCKPRLDAAHKKCSEKQKITVDAYRSYKELLARPDIHAVLIASPEHWHVPMAIDAIAAGKDVYVEKPLTLRIEDALHLRSVVDANEQILQVGTQYMMYPKYSEAKKLIAAGKIGHPTLSQTSYCRNSKDGEWLYTVDPTVVPGEMLDWEAWCGPKGKHPFDTNVYHRWRRYRTWSTGIVGDLLPHMMTPMMWAVDAGWPVRVTGSGGHYVFKDMENHDQVFLTAEFEKEHTMIVAGSVCNDSGLEVMIRGHKANLLLGSNNVVLQPQKDFVDEIEEQKIQVTDGADPQDELRLNWFHSIRTREPNRSPIEMACRMMVVIDLATRSLWEGRAFEFDPKTLTAHAT